MYYNNYCYYGTQGSSRMAAPGSPVQLLCEPWVLRFVCWFLSVASLGRWNGYTPGSGLQD